MHLQYLYTQLVSQQNDVYVKYKFDSSHNKIKIKILSRINIFYSSNKINIFMLQ